MSLNRVVIVGRLTKDPELRFTPNGVATARFTVAVNRTFTNAKGEKEVDFIQCVAWKKQAENLANFIKKGGLIGVDGRIQTGSYEGQDGKRVYTTDVVADSIQFLESKNGNSENGQAQTNNAYQNQPPAQQQYQALPQQPVQQNQPPQQPQGNFNYGNGQQQQNYNWSGQQQKPAQQPNYTRVDEDPFANSKGPVIVDPEDLPF